MLKKRWKTLQSTKKRKTGSLNLTTIFNMATGAIFCDRTIIKALQEKH